MAAAFTHDMCNMHALRFNCKEVEPVPPWLLNPTGKKNVVYGMHKQKKSREKTEKKQKKRYVLYRMHTNRDNSCKMRNTLSHWMC